MSRKSTDTTYMYLEHGIDIPSRTILLTSYADAEGVEAGIDWQIADRVIRGLRLMPETDVPVTLIINNHGGEDDHARAIIGAIRNCASPVHGLVLGRAESASAWILQHCDYRIMDKYSNLMLHMGENVQDKHCLHVDDIFIDDILLRIRERKPRYRRHLLVDKLHTDWYVYPEQALELGLADDIL